MPKFSKRKVWELQNNNIHKGTFSSFFNIKSLFRFFMVILCLLFVIYSWKFLVNAAKNTFKTISNWAVNIVSETLWKEMKKDRFWNINILLVWYGGKKHSWWFLADSIMVASWNPNLWAVTLISIPRDLYIHLKIDKRFVSWRINEVFAVGYRWNDNDVDKAWQVFGEKLKEILWLDISYYALVDFDWFEKVIDTLWGLDIFVDKDLYDPAYPDGNWNYETLYITWWQKKIDWVTALKYARSRHSTSDFDRAARQQTIIKAIMDQVKTQWIFKNIWKIQGLYKNYTEMVDTNISVDEIIWMMKYATNLKSMFQFVLTTHYSERDWKRSTAWWFLYTPSLEAFGWMSVILPNGASSSKVSYYDYIKNFVFYVVHNQEYLIENPKIWVFNWVDPAYAKKIARKNMEWVASKMAVKLKKYAFNVTDVQNSERFSSGTIVYIRNTWDRQETIETIGSFINISEVIALWSWFLDTWVDMKLIIWSEYVDQTLWKKFNYDMP